MLLLLKSLLKEQVRIFLVEYIFNQKYVKCLFTENNLFCWRSWHCGWAFSFFTLGAKPEESHLCCWSQNSEMLRSFGKPHSWRQESNMERHAELLFHIAINLVNVNSCILILHILVCHTQSMSVPCRKWKICTLSLRYSHGQFFKD